MECKPVVGSALTFCGLKSFQNNEPCHATELVKFRQRIEAQGVAIIFQCSVALHGEAVQETTVNIDTTVQEKSKRKSNTTLNSQYTFR